jgi:hypothetical protein
MEYTLVENRNRDELIREVEGLIKQGWKPLGGIAVAIIAPMLDIFMFCQAMIKE